jgi:DNA-damage-inducible protein J
MQAPKNNSTQANQEIGQLKTLCTVVTTRLQCKFINLMEKDMSTADTYVRARIDAHTKERAATALEAMGLSISDAIRLLMLRIADEHRLPFDVKVPNAKTKKAIAELEAGKGKKFNSLDALMEDLNADD